MGAEDEKGFDFDVPVVADRREFFEQEALVSGPPVELPADLEPEEVAEALKAMRESASRRTGWVQKPEEDRDEAGPSSPGITPE